MPAITTARENKICHALMSLQVKNLKKQNNSFPALLYLGCDNEDVAERLAHYEETHEGHTHGKNLVN